MEVRSPSRRTELRWNFDQHVFDFTVEPATYHVNTNMTGGSDMTQYFRAAEELKKDDAVRVDDDGLVRKAGTGFNFSVLEARSRSVRHVDFVLSRAEQRLVLEALKCHVDEGLHLHGHYGSDETDASDVDGLGLRLCRSLGIDPAGRSWLMGVQRIIEGATVHFSRDGSVRVEHGEHGTVLEGMVELDGSVSWKLTTPEA